MGDIYYKITWSHLYKLSDIPNKYIGMKGVYILEGPHDIYAPKSRTVLYIGQSKSNLASRPVRSVKRKLWHIDKDKIRIRYGLIRVLKVTGRRKLKKLKDIDVDCVEKALIYNLAPAYNLNSIDGFYPEHNIYIKNEGPGFIRKKIKVD